MSILNVKILHKPFRNKVLTVVCLEIFEFSLVLCKPVRLLRRSQPGWRAEHTVLGYLHCELCIRQEQPSVPCSCQKTPFSGSLNSMERGVNGVGEVMRF